jgi:hypothetical protein
MGLYPEFGIRRDCEARPEFIRVIRDKSRAGMRKQVSITLNRSRMHAHLSDTSLQWLHLTTSSKMSRLIYRAERLGLLLYIAPLRRAVNIYIGRWPLCLFGNGT